jgi:acyl CoA:acetate/3-ketoacid CoA transferase
VPKFVSSVHQRGFSATRARTDGQRVIYVTERAVFRLTEAGIELIEVAPGIDIQTQILDQMRFTPVIRTVAPMAPHLFRVLP